MLKTLLASKDGEAAFSHLLDVWRTYGEDAAHTELLKVICERYWRTAGEYFELEGRLGWGPGHREWEGESDYPPMEQGAVDSLRMFLHKLASMSPEPILAKLAKSEDKAGVIFRKTVLGSKAGEYRILEVIYSKIANLRTPYELGAARPFFKLWSDLGRFEAAMAGLVAILVKGLDRKQVQREMVFASMPVLAERVTQPAIEVAI